MGSPPTPKKPIAWPEIPCEGELSFQVVQTDKKFQYGELQEYREDDWRKRVLAYEEDPTDFHNAWWWLNNHPIFYECSREFHERDLNHDRGVLDGCIEVIPVKVNPQDNTRWTDSTKNTKLRFWVEVSPRSIQPSCDHSLHDYPCDTGGDTYESAIVEVAREIYERHGNDRAHLDEEWKQIPMKEHPRHEH